MTFHIEPHSLNGVFQSYVLYTDDDEWTEQPLSIEDPIGEIYGRTREEAKEISDRIVVALNTHDLLVSSLEDLASYLEINLEGEDESHPDWNRLRIAQLVLVNAREN